MYCCGAIALAQRSLSLREPKGDNRSLGDQVTVLVAAGRTSRPLPNFHLAQIAEEYLNEGALLARAPTIFAAITSPTRKSSDGRDVIIKVTSCAICGSDLHLMDGLMPTMESGDILGHEFMGAR